MCRTSNAAIYRECERKSSWCLVSYWTFAPRCAALLWPPGEIHGAETRLSGMPGRAPVRLLPPCDHAMNSAVPDRRINGCRLRRGLGRPPILVRGEPAAGRLGLLRVGRGVGHDPLELMDRLVLQVEPGGADGEVVMEEQALGVLLEGGAEVTRRDRPLLGRDRLARLGGVVDGGRRDLRGAPAGAQHQREADRRQDERSPHRPGIS